MNNQAQGLASRKILVEFEHGPDGLVADILGNIYVALMHKTDPGIYVYTPDGEKVGHIPTPEPPTNVGFGRGQDADILYITAGNALYRTRLATPGYQLPPEE